MSSFADLGIPSDLLDALATKGLVDAYPVQAATIPDALAGRDVCGRAPTGSGKTLAFGIPLVANVDRARPKRPRGLVLVPTRELAAQVARDLTWLGIERGVRVASFYGGVGFEKQLKALRAGVDIAVACPGRLADLVNQNRLRLDGVDHVVIDEADRMADMGFLPEVRRLLDQTASDRQTLLFSATLDGDVDVLIRNYQTDPVHHDVTPPDTEPSRLEHHFWRVERPKRVELCASIVDHTGPTIIFTRTRHGADRLARQLAKVGITTASIHGDRSQRQRDRALAEFTSGRVRALVATDVAARGIHVDDVACVIHHDLPADEKDYVHRSGRTGRAQAEGIVVAMVLPEQNKDADKLIRKLDLGVRVGEPDLLALGEVTDIPPRQIPTARDRGRPSNSKHASARRKSPGGASRADRRDRYENRNVRKARSLGPEKPDDEGTTPPRRKRQARNGPASSRPRGARPTGKGTSAGRDGTKAKSSRGQGGNRSSGSESRGRKTQNRKGR